jgi:Fe-S oxidoreductase
MTTMLLEKSPSHARAGRIAELADQCVQCGLYLPVCPTYALDRNEAESPRGRIAIASALARGLADPTAGLRAHLDHCLGCLNCETVCPAQVQYGELLVETRALLGPSPQRPRWLLELVKRPALLRVLRQLGGWLALSRWKDPLARRLPAASPWRAALLNLPSTPPAARVRVRHAVRGQPHLALFPGCVASVDDAEAQQAAITLLQATGFQVSVARSDSALLQLLRRVPGLEVLPLPRPPHCCGAAGSHLLEFPARAAQLRDDTLRQAATLDPQLLLSSNIGCRLHLAAGIDAQGLPWPTRHPLTLLAQQLEQPPSNQESP